MVNGKKAGTLTLPPANEVVAPLQLDLRNYLQPGDNQVTLELPAGSFPMTAQFLTNYYVPWTADAPAVEATERDGSTKLKLAVTYSRTSPGTDESVECKVKAERVGFRGYGMMLGEIGLPPGADVDRESLESAVKNNWSIDQYDVLPDRIIVYVWPKAGGTEFAFKFRMRFPVDAQTAPSQLYDYYNPDSSVVLKPIHFGPARQGN